MQYRSSLSLALTVFSLFFILTSSFTCSGSKEAVIGIKTGNLAPEILCDGMKGDCASLSSLEGKLVLVEFWTAASNICRQAHFEMGRMYNTFKDQSRKLRTGDLPVMFEADKGKWFPGTPPA